VREAVSRVIEAASRAGKACGLHVVHPEERAIRDALQAGYTFLAIGVDMIFLGEAAGRGSSLFFRKGEEP
jgi:2-keto-3-deoxy-L-rhamnonate aldolase RhmA